MLWRCNGAAVNDSLSAHQSLADRCKKIHAGDEVIQVNHQTVVSPCFFAFRLFFFSYLMSEFAYVSFFLCKCLFNSHIHRTTCLRLCVCCECVCSSFVHTHSGPPQGSCLDLLLYKWLHVEPLVGSFRGCGCVTLSGWMRYFPRHGVGQTIS